MPHPDDHNAAVVIRKRAKDLILRSGVRAASTGIGHQNPTPQMAARFGHQFTPPFTVARFTRLLKATHTHLLANDAGTPTLGVHISSITNNSPSPRQTDQPQSNWTPSSLSARSSKVSNGPWPTWLTNATCQQSAKSGAPVCLNSHSACSSAGSDWNSSSDTPMSASKAAVCER